MSRLLCSLPFLLRKFFRVHYSGELPIGKFCLLGFPVCLFFSGVLREPLLAVFIASFYVVGLAGLILFYNVQFRPEGKRLGDVLAAGLFVFVSYGGLEFSNWFIPSLYKAGGG